MYAQQSQTKPKNWYSPLVERIHCIFNFLLWILFGWSKMPPPKARLHSKTGKLKTINKTYSSSSPSGQETGSTSSSRRNNRAAENTVTQNEVRTNTSAPAASSAPSPIASTSDTMQQFEIELCWCIQTMEKSLESGGITAKQGACDSVEAAISVCHPQLSSIFCFLCLCLLCSSRYREEHPFVEKCQSAIGKKAANHERRIRWLSSQNARWRETLKFRLAPMHSIIFFHSFNQSFNRHEILTLNINITHTWPGNDVRFRSKWQFRDFLRSANNAKNAKQNRYVVISLQFYGNRNTFISLYRR